jgi:hypothetical protein
MLKRPRPSTGALDDGDGDGDGRVFLGRTGAATGSGGG